jgi:hypothetical protein
MEEFKGGELHSGSSTGPVVRNRKQAIAIAISEQKKRNGVPAPHKNLGKYLHPMKGGK